MEFGILGPLVVWRDGREVPIGAAKQRALLALLVLGRGELVATETLMEGLWGERPPATGVKAVQVYVSQLRKTLGEGLLETRPGGYLIRLEPDALDAARFEALLARGRGLLAEGEADEARAVLREALGLWRGTALAEFRYEEFARDEIGRLEGLRLVALEQRLEADLALGRHAEAVPELQALVREHPLRESLRRLLILALYRADRQADALAAYHDARGELVEGLGLDPGESLRQLETAILRHDPALDLPRPARAPPPVALTGPTASGLPPGASPGQAAVQGARAAVWRARLRTRRWLGAGFAGLLVAGGLIAALVVILRGPGAARALSHVDANAVGLINPKTDRIVEEVPVGATPSHLAVGEGAVWVTNGDGDSVSRIDPEAGVVVETIPVGSSPSGITTGNGAVWVADSLDGTVTRIDPTTNTQRQVIRVGNGPVGITYAAGSVWVANTGDGTVTRIDSDSGKPSPPLAIAATELAYGAGALWASESSASRVVRIDPATGLVVAMIPVGNGPSGIAFGGGAAWVTNSLDGTVSRIDPSTNSVAATIPSGDGPTAVAVGAGGVWVSNEFAGTLVRIDPRTNQVVRRISVGNRPQAVAIAGGTVLVSVRQSGADQRGGTLTVRMNRPPDSIDTAIAYGTTSWPILRMTSDGLVAFNQTSGLQGTHLVPDLAVSLPTPTDNGRTYTFQLRPNIRYSNGQTVKASDFRTTLERDFKLDTDAPPSYYGGIIGAARCQDNPKRCDLSRGIVADDAARTVAFHLVAPDPEFLYKLALPFTYVVPANTPIRAVDTHPLPATGPYMISSYRPNHLLTLVRNPRFHQWSQAAQPDGYPDKIVFEIGGTPDEDVNDVIRGKADAFSTALSETPPSEGLLATLETRYASQVYTNPQPATVALFLNTRLAPFNSLDVRRALNYAADRAAAVNAVGGPELAQTTCQILPPDYPGYKPYCPYSAGATTNGNWTAPELAKARALVAQSGTRDMKVTFWSWADIPRLGPFTIKLLRALGYRVSLKIPNANAYFGLMGNSRVKVQMGVVEWISDYPAASGFFDPILTCASFEPNSANYSNFSEFCDPRIDRQIAQALSKQTTSPDAAGRLWERIDRQTVNQAPWVPLVNPKVVDVLSKRVGDYQYSPDGLGMLIDQLWVR